MRTTRQWANRPGCRCEQSGPPPAEALVGPQPFVLPPGPAPQVGVDALQEGIERGPVEPAVVVDPPGDDGVQPSRQVVQRQVGAPVDPHRAELGAFGLERLGADRRQEAGEVPAVLAARPPCPEGVPEEGERGVLVLCPAPTVLAVDDPRLVRVKPEPDLVASARRSGQAHPRPAAASCSARSRRRRSARTGSPGSSGPSTNRTRSA